MVRQALAQGSRAVHLTTLDLAQESVGRKRRSCSGSRNGTPAVRDRRSASVDPTETAAMLAEDNALDASLAAAQAAAAHAAKQVINSLL